jgi:hypothetical protein
VIRFVLAAIMLSSPVLAADKCVVVTDNDATALSQIFEAATGSQKFPAGGLDMARLVTYWSNKVVVSGPCPPPPPPTPSGQK